MFSKGSMGQQLLGVVWCGWDLVGPLVQGYDMWDPMSVYPLIYRLMDGVPVGRKGKESF